VKRILPGLAILLTGFFGLYFATADAKPCQYHRGDGKAKCLKHRALQQYPSAPTWKDFKSRATAYEYATLRRIAVCEMGGSGKGEPWDVKWGVLYSTYSSAFGIWNGNFAYTSQATGYKWPTSNKAEEAFHALSLARRYGFSAWGCF